MSSMKRREAGRQFDRFERHGPDIGTRSGTGNTTASGGGEGRPSPRVGPVSRWGLSGVNFAGSQESTPEAATRSWTSVSPALFVQLDPEPLGQFGRGAPSSGTLQTGQGSPGAPQPHACGAFPRTLWMGFADPATILAARARAHGSSSEQGSPRLGELHIGAALVQHQPALGYRMLKAGFVFGRRPLQFEQKRPVDFLDVDPAVLDRLEGIGELQQLAGCGLGIGEGAGGDEFSCSLHVRSVDVLHRASDFDLGAAEASRTAVWQLRRQPASSVPHCVFSVSERALAPVLLEVGFGQLWQ